MGKDDYIQTNVILICDKGTMPVPFIATPKTQNHHSITGGTIRDNIPLLNILPFGVCTVTRYPCIPVMPIWQDYPKSPWYIEGFQPLLLSSCAKCMLGGTIRILTSYMEVPAAMKDIPKTWKEKLLAEIDKGIGKALLSPIGPILELAGMGDVVQGVGEFGRGVVQGIGKGLASTVEGLYNMVTHPLETLGGIATLAGTAIVGYTLPIPGITPEMRLEAFDEKFGTNLSDVNAGIKQSLSDSVDTLIHGSNVEKGEIVGQAIEFIAEIAVGTKGAGAALKSVKGGSMGAKMAKGAGYVDKVLDFTKTTGKTLKEWTLGKLPKSKKGIFGKKMLPKLPQKPTKQQKGNFGEIHSKHNLTKNKSFTSKTTGKKYELTRIGQNAPEGLDSAIRQGIDGIYKNSSPPPKYVIDEAKFGTSSLKQTNDGMQMSDEWLLNSRRIEKQFPDTPDGRRQANDVREAILNGEVEKVVSHIDESGNVTTRRVEGTGRDAQIGSLWP